MCSRGKSSVGYKTNKKTPQLQPAGKERKAGTGRMTARMGRRGHIQKEVGRTSKPRCQGQERTVKDDTTVLSWGTGGVTICLQKKQKAKDISLCGWKETEGWANPQRAVHPRTSMEVCSWDTQGTSSLLTSTGAGLQTSVCKPCPSDHVGPQHLHFISES